MREFQSGYIDVLLFPGVTKEGDFSPREWKRLDQNLDAFEAGPLTADEKDCMRLFGDANRPTLHWFT